MASHGSLKPVFKPALYIPLNLTSSGLIKSFGKKFVICGGGAVCPENIKKQEEKTFIL